MSGPACRRTTSGRIPHGPRCLESSRQLVTALAAAVLKDLAAGAGGHTGTEPVLLGPLADIWLVRALHELSPDDECSEAMPHATDRVTESRAVEVGTHQRPPLHENPPMLRASAPTFQQKDHLSRLNFHIVNSCGQSRRAIRQLVESARSSRSTYGGTRAKPRVFAVIHTHSAPSWSSVWSAREGWISGISTSVERPVERGWRNRHERL